jgi:hypothetical protein
MAGQEETQVGRLSDLRYNWLAVDPGDRWVGYARLQLNAGIVTAQTGTIDATKRSFRLVVDAVLGAAFHGTIVTEAYHVRPQGHQAFSRGETLQLIGALRYFADARGCAWHDVPAGDPDRELEERALHDHHAPIITWRFHGADRAREAGTDRRADPSA